MLKLPLDLCPLIPIAAPPSKSLLIKKFLQKQVKSKCLIIVFIEVENNVFFMDFYALVFYLFQKDLRKRCDTCTHRTQYFSSHRRFSINVQRQKQARNWFTPNASVKNASLQQHLWKMRELQISFCNSILIIIIQQFFLNQRTSWKDGESSFAHII